MAGNKVGEYRSTTGKYSVLQAGEGEWRVASGQSGELLAGVRGEIAAVPGEVVHHAGESGPRLFSLACRGSLGVTGAITSTVWPNGISLSVLFFAGRKISGGA